MIDDAMKTERPTVITLISIWEILGGLLLFYYIFGGHGSSTVDVLHLVVGSFFSVICGIGFWFMKKWAVYV